jgi:alkylation response protein AidB-like acyl-CoA dehydrogenase
VIVRASPSEPIDPHEEDHVITDERIAPALDEARRHAVEVDREARFPDEAIAALSAEGAMGLTLPKEVGGLGLGPVEFLETVSAVAEACASSAMVYLMHVCAAQVVAAGGGDPELLRSMADGSSLGTLAFSERGSRGHFWAPVSQIGGGRISASKSFVTSAGHAGTYVVSTRAEGADSPLASTLYAVDRSAAGLQVEEPWVGLGLRGNASAPMTIDMAVEDARPLGEEGKGLDLMLGVVLPWFQLGQGGVSLGIARASVGAAVGHVTTARFEHLGEALIDLPVVRARLGRAQTEVDELSGFLEDLARRMGEGDAQAPILSAKAVANETAVRVTSEMMHACGGAAMSPSLPLERHLRDARAGSVMAPSTDVSYELTGRALAGMPLLG